MVVAFAIPTSNSSEERNLSDAERCWRLGPLHAPRGQQEHETKYAGPPKGSTVGSTLSVVINGSATYVGTLLIFATTPRANTIFQVIFRICWTMSTVNLTLYSQISSDVRPPCLPLRRNGHNSSSCWTIMPTDVCLKYPNHPRHLSQGHSKIVVSRTIQRR